MLLDRYFRLKSLSVCDSEKVEFGCCSEGLALKARVGS